MPGIRFFFLYQEIYFSFCDSRVRIGQVSRSVRTPIRCWCCCENCAAAAVVVDPLVPLPLLSLRLDSNDVCLIYTCSRLLALLRTYGMISAAVSRCCLWDCTATDRQGQTSPTETQKLITQAKGPRTNKRKASTNITHLRRSLGQLLRDRGQLRGGDPRLRLAVQVVALHGARVCAQQSNATRVLSCRLSIFC